VRRLQELDVEVATFRRGERADYRGDRRDLPRRRDELARFAPDVVVDTIAYAERELPKPMALAPILWRAQEFCLIDSVGGAHNEIARWPLHA